jgi:hypothetical protein
VFVVLQDHAPIADGRAVTDGLLDESPGPSREVVDKLREPFAHSLAESRGVTHVTALAHAASDVRGNNAWTDETVRDPLPPDSLATSADGCGADP